jgi:hypothetical protein
MTLVLKQVYEWELYMVSVRPRPVRDFKPLPPSFTPKVYIPAGTLPPREVPGCWFEMPQSDQWKLDHRKVTFMEFPDGTN